MNPKITQIELNLSRSTINRILNRLQQREIVIRKGSNRNGYWTVKEGYPNFLGASNLGGNLGDKNEK